MSFGSSPLILVAEDEDLVREVLCMDLEEAGFAVLSARTGEAALQLLLARRDVGPRIQALVTDIRMPGAIDGWELAERVRQIQPDIGVVYTSGFINGADRSVPGSAHLRKPYRFPALLDCLSSLVPA